MFYSEKCHKESFSTHIRSCPLYAEKVIVNILNYKENEGNRILGDMVI